MRGLKVKLIFSEKKLALSRPHGFSRKWILLTAAILLGACQFTGHISVVSGSTNSKLVLAFSESSHSERTGRLRSVSVYRYTDIYKRTYGYYPPGNQAVWRAYVPSGKEAPLVARLEYGESQGDLLTTVGPLPLEKPGCYVVDAQSDYGDRRSATVGFRIDASGQAREMSSVDFKSLFSDGKREQTFTSAR